MMQLSISGELKLKILFVSMVLLACCQKEDISFSEHSSDTFFVENKGSSMRVLVEGNTAGKVFILLIHGGPGASAYVYNTNYVSENLEDKYAMVYWDQRNSGASQGTCNGSNLTFDQIVDDLAKVIQVIKIRYGNDIDLFLLSHSFGGLVASGFLTKGNNQNLFKGYINVDGSHNYPLNDTLTRDMLLTVGSQEVANNHHVDDWNKIIDYCNSHAGNFTLYQSHKLEKYASQAEDYIEAVNQIKYFPIVLRNSISGSYPITSMLVNFLYSENSDLNKEISIKEFSSSLKRITIPSLVLFGKYDFVCPPELGLDFYTRISSQEKKMVISPVSGHNLIYQDRELFSREVTDFVEKFR
jgi:pimeloyl-ACP methyl ester carboxylesterase